MNHSKLLINESPLTILPSLAELIGLNEAVMLQQIHYWLKINEQAGKESTHFRDGKWWTYNTAEEWQESNFPFWSVNTVRRILESLEEKGLVITGNYNKLKFDRTKWYSVDYDELNSIYSNWVNASTQDGQMQVPNMGNTIPETNAETTTDVNITSFDNDKLEKIKEVWNQNRGNLPEVRSINGSRRKLVYRAYNNFGDDTLEMLEAATKYVVANGFYEEKGYNFDNLVRNLEGNYQKAVAKVSVGADADEVAEFDELLGEYE